LGIVNERELEELESDFSNASEDLVRGVELLNTLFGL
jgi:hypothetical protein